jgi:ZIP family zinc transporter
MMLISFFELIPESVGAAGILKPLIAVFLGVILVGILNFIVPHTHLVEEKGHIHIRSLKAAYLVAFGLILHDFPEGFAMANSFIYSPSLGLLIALAIAIHNIPEEFARAVPLLLTEKKKLLFKVAFLSGLAEPAGAMIFDSIHELLPMACRYKRMSLFILGVILSVIVYTGLAMFT